MFLTLVTLLDDVLLHLLTILPLSDVLHIRQTCKRLHVLTKLRTVWCDKFFLEVLSKNLPIPGDLLPFEELSGDDLEWRTRQALLLDRNWRVRRINDPVNITISAPKEGASQVILLPGGHGAVTVHAHSALLWLIEPTSPSKYSVKQCAEWNFPVAGCEVVRDLAYSDHIAIGWSEGPSSRVVVLSVGPGHPFQVLGQRAALNGTLVGLHDNFLLMDISATTDSDGVKGLALVDWKSSSDGIAILESHPNYGKYLGFTFYEFHIVVLWECCLGMFPVPSIPTQSQISVAPAQICVLRQRVQSPVCFTPCRPRQLPGTPYPGASEGEGCGGLSVIARCNERIWGSSNNISRSILYPVDGSGKVFELAKIPTQIGEDCSAMYIGASGRGVWMENGNVRQCSPRDILGCGGQLKTVEFDDYGKPLWRIPRRLEEGGSCLDFDDGLGRIATVSGKDIEIVDLVGLAKV